MPLTSAGLKTLGSMAKTYGKKKSNTMRTFGGNIGP